MTRIYEICSHLAFLSALWLLVVGILNPEVFDLDHIIICILYGLCFNAWYRLDKLEEWCGL